MKRAKNTYILLVALLAAWLVGCERAGTTTDTGTSADASSEIYTCPMHPQIQQPEPGNCPICGMNLVPMKTGGLNLSDAAKALANIQTTTIKHGPAVRMIDLFGVIAPDDTRLATVTARFPGRIERLFVNFVGTRVRKGEHLAEIYSDQLVEVQSELIGALRFDTNASSAEGIKERLRLWDIPEDQIDLIDSTREPVYRVRIDSPTGGVVTQLDVHEGDYVQTGSRLFEVTDLSQLWVHFDAYETDLPWLRYGQQVEIRAKAYPGETFGGTIAFIQPVLDRETHTIKVRVNVANPDGKLRPGMFVRGQAQAHLGSGGQVIAPELAGKWIGPMHPEIVSYEPGDCPICGMPLEPASELGYAAYDPGAPPLLIPATAVLRTGPRAVVYLEEPDGSFSGREINLGPRAGDYFVVKSGLTEGDIVVTNGAFRLDSELQIMAKPSMMNPEAGTTADNVEVDATKDREKSVPIEVKHQNIPQQFPRNAQLDEAISTALQSYFAIESDFGQDKFDAIKPAADNLAKALQSIPMQAVPADAMSVIMANQAAGVLGAQRLTADPQANRGDGLNAVSEALIGLVQTFRYSGSETLYLMYCPMAQGDLGARWLQQSSEVTNPYYGAMMLRCGEALAVWNPQTATWDDHE